MSAIGNPNWLILAGMLFLGCGLVLMSSSTIGRLGQTFDPKDAWRAACQRQVDGLMSVPLLTIGLALVMAGQFYRVELDATVVVLALSVPAALIVYWGLEGLLVERLVNHEQRHDKAWQALPPRQIDPSPSEQRSSLQIVHTPDRRDGAASANV